MVNESNNINLIVKENYKKTEEVREIANEFPNFEEFMKTYEYDSNLNYADLNSWDIGSSRGYGPCEYYDCPYSSSCRFYIRMGFSGEKFHFQERGPNKSLLETFYGITIKNIQQARNFLNKLEKEMDEEGKYIVWEREFFSGGPGDRNACKEGEIKEGLHEQIKKHEAGKEVYEVHKDFNEGACSSVIM